MENKNIVHCIDCTRYKDDCQGYEHPDDRIGRCCDSYRAKSPTKELSDEEFQKALEIINQTLHPTFFQIVCTEMDKTKTLFLEKSQQYGIGDALANFRDVAAAMQLDPQNLDNCFVALKGYCNKHISFVQRSTTLTPKVVESLRDIANYAFIAIAMEQMKEMEGK